MSGLVLKLRPGERVIVNGVVLENGDRRARLNVLSADANVLRLRDAIHPSEATTPVKRVCYVAQLAVAGEADPDEARRQLLLGVDQLSQVFRTGPHRETLRKAADHAGERRFYPALRALRSLLPIEQQLLERSVGRA